MARICFDRIISDRYQPARAEAYRAAVQHFQANSLTMMKERNLKPQALGELHADDPIVRAKMAGESGRECEDLGAIRQRQAQLRG